MERLKTRGGEVTERFLVNFMEHQVSRIETCVSTLAMRHLAKGNIVLRELNELRAPMAAIFDHFKQQQDELARYKALYGPLPDDNAPKQIEDSTSGCTK
ncbi:hypothetical protein NQ176_g6495 [Zarea fungicola]|uniref:Uncharacterized protein n=1 Tax=Zarea fungicola TaxID=93591 RepID=A0ACC1N5C2_9HYPO|nr:hypothetical protein NQ176_g6495 [Lecanicillium fungicola]